MSKPKVHDYIRGGSKEYHTESQEESMHTGKAAGPKPRSKYVPKGIDPAYPQKNFVKAHYENKGDDRGYFDYMMGPTSSIYGEPMPKKQPSCFSGTKKSGKLRVSGAKGAHQIGRR